MGLSLSRKFGGVGGLLVGVVGGLVLPGLIDHEPVGPIGLLEQRDAHVSGLLERAVAVLLEQRHALARRARRDIEAGHAIDGVTAALGLRAGPAAIASSKAIPNTHRATAERPARLRTEIIGVSSGMAAFFGCLAPDVSAPADSRGDFLEIRDFTGLTKRSWLAQTWAPEPVSRRL